MCNKSLVSEVLNHTDVLFQMNSNRHDFSIQSFNPHSGNTFRVWSTEMAFSLWPTPPCSNRSTSQWKMDYLTHTQKTHNGQGVLWMQTKRLFTFPIGLRVNTWRYFPLFLPFSFLPFILYKCLLRTYNVSYTVLKIRDIIKKDTEGKNFSWRCNLQHGGYN